MLLAKIAIVIGLFYGFCMTLGWMTEVITTFSVFFPSAVVLTVAWIGGTVLVCTYGFDISIEDIGS